MSTIEEVDVKKTLDEIAKIEGNVCFLGGLFFNFSVKNMSDQSFNRKQPSLLNNYSSSKNGL